MENKDELIMSFDPNTIQHLGIHLYSTFPPVLLELIANSYDADAEKVLIKIEEGPKKTVVIQDDGDGMTFEEINDKFLRIGRNRREDESKQKTAKGRLIIGKKGLGKLSFFGIAKKVTISTRKNGKENKFLMTWDSIKNSKDREYRPKILDKDKICSEKTNGTTIILSDIKRESPFDINSLADSISKSFLFDKDFMVMIQHDNDEPVVITNDRKYENIEKQICWKIPEDVKLESDYKNKEKILGEIIATKLPISPKSEMRGITLFSRKKLVNVPEYFSSSTSSHFFSYLTGWLQVDFIDEIEDDVISTTRLSLNWEQEDMIRLREYLTQLVGWLQNDWRKKRDEIGRKDIEKNTGINIDNWFEKTPLEVKENLTPIVQAIIKNEEVPGYSNSTIIQKLHSVLPEYTYYHYRHLHEEIKDASGGDYRDGDYYNAFSEAIKRYINTAKTKASPINAKKDFEAMDIIFGPAAKLTVMNGYKRRSGNEFDRDTKKSIELGQNLLSKGIIEGGRNGLSHEEIEDMKVSGLFTEKDCLDMLSVVSHLFRRLDDAKLR